MSCDNTPYHRRYHAEHLRADRELTLKQRGAYATILDLIHKEAGPIERNERWLAGQMNCSLREVRTLLNELIDSGKIHLTADGKLSKE